MRNEPHHPDASLEPIAFFCRAKPQNADALQIFKCARRVFIGHPLLRNGEPYDPSALRRCLVNPTCPDEEWAREIELQSTTQHYNKNRNFIREVTPGSIVVIPRPEQGAVYAGRIIGSFEIVDSPPWADAYLALRAEQKVNIEDKEKPHIADVAQGWPVDEYRRIYLSRLPGWLRHSMFGRPTFGRFQNHPINGTTAHDMMAHILDGGSTIPVSWTLELDKIKCRLVDTLTASAFEHLVVSLLQLERPNEIWYQAGGPGDGGIDGFGTRIPQLKPATAGAKPDGGNAAGVWRVARGGGELHPAGAGGSVCCLRRTDINSIKTTSPAARSRGARRTIRVTKKATKKEGAR